MFSKTLKSLAVAALLAGSMAYAQDGVKFWVADGDKEAAYNKLVNDKIQAIGYKLSDPHERINDAYNDKWGIKGKAGFDPTYKKNLDNLGFMSITNDDKLRELLMKEPSLGGFSPFNLHVYKETGVNKTYVGHITPETMLDITGVKDAGVRKEFIAMFPSLDDLIAKEIGGKVEMTTFDKLPAKPMMNFEVPIKLGEGEELNDWIEDTFQSAFEEKFEEKKYIIAGYKNFKEAYDEDGKKFDRFDAYFVYSLCHFKFSESIFNRGRPDAGAFAPCSMYMYIDKGTKTLKIGMPYLENWIAVMGIKDAKMQKSIRELDKEVISIMKSLGAKQI